MNSNPQKIYFNYSRAALTWGSQHLLNLKLGDVILIPEYICRVVPDALESAGYRVRYYSQKPGLLTDFNDLKAKAKSAQALIFVHYFGLAADFDKYRTIADDCKIFLIEDAAHVIGDSIGNREIGVGVDFSVQSLWKTLPIAMGSVLKTTHPMQLLPAIREEARPRKIRNFLKSVLVSSRFGRQIAWRKRLSNLNSHAIEKNIEPALLGMSSTVKIETFELHKQAEKRRQLDKKWRLWIEKKNLQPLAASNSGDVPWYTPVVANSLEQRNLLLKELYLGGILAATWPQLTDYALSHNHNSKLWETLLLLPIIPWDDKIKKFLDQG